MAAAESIYKYYLHQKSNLENYLEQCLILAEPEVVHQLRLCIKKLRAFNILAREIGLDPHEVSHQMTFRLKKMFKLAGQIRDIQVQIMLLAVHEGKSGFAFIEFRKWLLKREKKRILRLCKIPFSNTQKETSHGIPHETELQLSELSDETILNSAYTVLDNLYAKAAKLATGQINNENLHRIRKISKQLKFILNIMFSSYPDFHFDRIPISTLREIDVAAGHWHDNFLRIELLGRFMEKIQSCDESTQNNCREFMKICYSELEVAYEEACLLVKSKLI